jgi:hypothetical protein
MAGLTPAALAVAYPATAQAAGCVGHTEFNLPTYYGTHPYALLAAHGWYTKEANGKTCIGTVVVSVYTSVTGNDWDIANISWASRHNHPVVKSKYVYAFKGNYGVASFGFHSSGKSPFVAALSGYTNWAIGKTI